MTHDATVSVSREEGEAAYSQRSPFHPPEPYPEYPFQTQLDPTNRAYRLVRDALVALRLDETSLGTQAWSPLRGIVLPGDTVLVKPNLVKHFHNTGRSIESVIVHGSVIRAILDYVWLALKGQGRIVIADTPLDKTDFARMCELCGLGPTVRFLRETCGVPVELLDLRSSRTHIGLGGAVSEEPLPGDPLGYVSVDLGRDSQLAELDGPGTNYHTLGDHSVDHYDPCTAEKGQPNQHHNEHEHTYRVGRTVLNADAVISVAKLKTHKKAGVTLNLKNMIGIVDGKAFIPHHRPGAPPQGDAFPVRPPRTFVAKRYVRQGTARLLARSEWLYSCARGVAKRAAELFRLAPRKYAEWGEWHGNDTLWRTILDANRILFYADRLGTMRETKQRRYFCFVDGIVAMEGDGPMGGEPVGAGVVLAGADPVAVDAVAARIMGFDPARIPTIQHAGKPGRFELGASDGGRIKVVARQDAPLHTSFRFQAAPGWVGHIEYDE